MHNASGAGVDWKKEVRMDELTPRTKAGIIATYFVINKLRKYQIRNRRQRRLWKVVHGPFKVYVNYLAKKVIAEYEDAVLYGVEIYKAEFSRQWSHEHGSNLTR